ncbi:MAG: two-component system response regulator OmpR, partial [Gammaproteobacteria bacterium HGW-Gammaproteobacteria-8]
MRFNSLSLPAPALQPPYNDRVDTKPAHLLIVDDDPEFSDRLARYLKENGFAVSQVADGSTMRNWFASNSPDLVLLDLMMPGEDGLSLARWLSASHRVPIIMLSARGEDTDRIVGLEVGADDYLPKPFNPRELLARIRARLRPRSDSGGGDEDRIQVFGPYRFDPIRFQLHRDDTPVELTHAEFALLQVLVEHPNQVLSRDRLMDLLKGYQRSPFDRSN